MAEPKIKIVPNRKRKTRFRELTTEERQQLAAAADGLTPLQFAASMLRDIDADLDDRKWAAELLMPYMHRKLPTAVDITSRSVNASVDLNALGDMSDEQLTNFLTTLDSFTRPIEDVEKSSNVIELIPHGDKRE